MLPTDLLDHPVDDRISLQALAREQRVAPPSPWRWAMRGVRGLRLPTVMVGSRRWTTRQAYRWWCERLTALADEQHATATVAPSRQRAVEAAEAELDRLGV